MAALPKPVSLVYQGPYRFVIMDAPKDSNLPAYVTELQANHVTDVVRVCDATYSPEPITRAGITFHDWPFPDGEAPPDAVIAQWLRLVESKFINTEGGQDSIAVHCVAGLGRAPVLVAIALIEGGTDWDTAVAQIRERRRGAINKTQLEFLKKYQPRGQGSKKPCLIQ